MNTHDDPPADSIEDRSASEAMHARIAEALVPLSPPAARMPGMRERLGARVADSIERHRGLHTVRRDETRWQGIANGVRAWVLHDNGASRSVLLEFRPGASVPAHRHAAHEECLVLRGSLDAGPCHVGVHDYHLAPAGSLHTGLSSAEGGMAFVRGTSVGSKLAMLREYLAGWLPASGDEPYTVTADSGEWREVGMGTHVKTLWRLGNEASLLMRLEAGASVPAMAGATARECLMVSGEAFFGDILLREGEYQLCPSDQPHGITYTDTGALLFMHADTAYTGA